MATFNHRQNAAFRSLAIDTNGNADDWNTRKKVRLWNVMEKITTEQVQTTWHIKQLTTVNINK